MMKYRDVPDKPERKSRIKRHERIRAGSAKNSDASAAIKEYAIKASAPAQVRASSSDTLIVDRSGSIRLNYKNEQVRKKIQETLKAYRKS